MGDRTQQCGQGVEREAIGGAIRRHHGNLTRTAQTLGIAKSTLYLKLELYALRPC